VLNKIDDEALRSCVKKLNCPEARVRFAEQLVLFSVCAIDISDGLAADLGHIVDASDCGAQVYLSDIPLSLASHYFFEKYNESVIDWPMLLTRGDDYELCFTVSEDKESAVNELAHQHALKISCIGEITEGDELKFFNTEGELVNFENAGFKHF
jgi:thiamine-monophosphate kinase